MEKVSIKLKSDGEIYQINADKHNLKVGDEILVETEHGTEIGLVITENCCHKDNISEKTASGAKREKCLEFIRKLSEVDREKINKLSTEAKTYLMECQQKIEKYNLPMRLLDSDLSYDGKKLTFYFTAPNRVDFRVLVSELAHSFKKVIRLQQIGTRDEARYLGGVGRCGKTVCCKQYLKGNLESVTLEMASDQNLAQMGSNRITGVCGKLMCCLKYELDFYQETKKTMPKIGEEFKTERGVGKIIGQNVVKKTISVKLKEGGSILEVGC